MLDFQIFSRFGILVDISNNNENISKGANKPQNYMADEELLV